MHNPWKSNAARRYCLVKRGTNPPAEFADATTLEIPLERLAVESTTHLPPLDRLGMIEALVGFPERKHICNPAVRERMAEGRIAALGSAPSVAAERLVEQRVQAWFASDFETGGGPDDAVLAKLGIAAVRTTEFTEEHPLGRLEWIKFFAPFFDKEAEAERIFEEQSQKYESLAAELRRVSKRPTVMANAPFRGVWQVPGNKTYLARLIADAGGEYLWADVDSSASQPLQFEAVLTKAADADVWLHPGLWKSRAEATAEDDRHRHFRPWKESRMYNNNLRVSPDGALEYWEEGLARPEELLRDLAVIFHPELPALKGAELRWHRKLP